MNPTDRLCFPTWKRSYELISIIGSFVHLTFQDGQRIMFDRDTVDWSVIIDTVETWERLSQA